MPALSLFPTRVYLSRLRSAGWRAFNRRLLQECLQLRTDDRAGRRWSASHYPGGYTSYNSLCRLYAISPTFDLLRRRLERHMRAFARTLQFDLAGRELTMTDCWANIMRERVTHGLHLHPLATLSGTYYVQTPRGCAGLKLEDPRLDRYMGAPPRVAEARRENRHWVTLPAEAGSFVLFESWLRHEVVPNPAAAERVSISFNYGWF